MKLFFPVVKFILRNDFLLKFQNKNYGNRTLCCYIDYDELVGRGTLVGVAGPVVLPDA